MNEDIIYTFWTGDNKMSNNRQKCLNNLKQKQNVKLYL